MRKKLKEYIEEGIVNSEKRGRNIYYSRAGETALDDSDLLDFFSEVSPAGVVGSFLLDKTDDHKSCFSFKHHYITGTIDSGIMYDLLRVMGERRYAELEMFGSGGGKNRRFRVVPLKIMISVQSGRQYLMASVPHYDRILSCRLDSIVSVAAGEVCENFDRLRDDFEMMRSNLWGVSTHGRAGNKPEHVDFTVVFRDDESYIPARLEREKRCGSIERIDANTIRFSADVYDSTELIPWIRTFIRRITDIHFSDAGIEKQFRDDIHEMYRLYGIDADERKETAK